MDSNPSILSHVSIFLLDPEGLNADAIEKLYQDLVNHFIDEEMKHWKQSEIK